LNDDMANGSSYKRAGFQVRIDIPEPTTALCEHPLDDNDPIPIRSILSAAPYVTILGVEAVYNTSGQYLDIINGDKVELGQLSVGTYVAQTKTGAVKITKLR